MLKKNQIIKLFKLLNAELVKENIKGELYLVGGAVMCLALAARPSTRDIDAYFIPTVLVRKAAQKIATENAIDENWLNDAVKGYLSPKGGFQAFLELSNLKIFCATPEYLLAMKCLAMRIGEEFQDLDDIKYLLRNLGLNKYKKTLEIIGKYYPIESFPPETLYALEELLGGP